METRPIPIVILAIIHFIEPFAKILFNAFYFNLSVGTICLGIWQDLDNVQNILALSLFPIAGLAILAMKRWSLLVVAIIEIFSLVMNIFILGHESGFGNISYILTQIFFYSLNLLVVAYLLIPAVRASYRDIGPRWWESSRRFQVAIQCKISPFNKVGIIQNLSRSGIYVALNGTEKENGLKLNSPLDVEFSVGKETFKLKGRVARCAFAPVEAGEEVYSGGGIGIRFEHRRFSLWFSLFILTLKMYFSGVPSRPRRGQFWIDLKNWTLHFMKTGRGLIPQCKERHQ